MSAQLSLPHVPGPGREHAPRRGCRRPPTFAGPKIPAPLITDHRWQRDVLVALSLDPRIARIEPLGVRETRGSLFDIGVTLAGGGSVIIRIVTDDAAVARAEQMPGVAVLAVTDFMRSPAVEARRSVWASRGAPVSAPDRWAVISALGQVEDGLTFAQVVGLVRTDARQAVDAVCAMACDGSIWIDLENGLAPEARVRLSRR